MRGSPLRFDSETENKTGRWICGKNKKIKQFVRVHWTTALMTKCTATMKSKLLNCFLLLYICNIYMLYAFIIWGIYIRVWAKHWRSYATQLYIKVEFNIQRIFDYRSLFILYMAIQPVLLNRFLPIWTFINTCTPHRKIEMN